MAATLKDLSKETGLSIATISKYINGIHIKQENEEVIRLAIEKLDYTVNEYARGLKSNKSRTIGIIIPELSNIFITHIITKIEDILRLNGYSAVICDCHSQEELECDAVKFLLSKMVDGIINMPICMDGRHLLPALEKNLPIVLIDRKIPAISENSDKVLINNVTASFNACSHLIENNHKKIGIIVGSEGIFTSELRLVGYKEALEKNNIEFNKNLVMNSDYTVHGGYESLKKLIDNNPEMSAVFVTNYEMTLGAIIYANEKGIKIPEKLSFIGFDNLDLSKVINPKLTIVSQPLEEIGENVAHMILNRLQNGYVGESMTKVLEANLSFGESVSLKK